MAPSAFANQLNAALAGSPHEPYLRMFDALNRVASTLESWLTTSAARSPVSVQVEPGFPAEMGQQFNVVVHIRDREVSDTLFRAYVSPDGTTALDFFGEEPTIVTDENELQRRVLEFLARPEVKSRVTIYKKLVERP